MHPPFLEQIEPCQQPAVLLGFPTERPLLASACAGETYSTSTSARTIRTRGLLFTSRICKTARISWLLKHWHSIWDLFSVATLSGYAICSHDLQWSSAASIERLAYIPKMRILTLLLLAIPMLCWQYQYFRRFSSCQWSPNGSTVVTVHHRSSLIFSVNATSWKSRCLMQGGSPEIGFHRSKPAALILGFIYGTGTQWFFLKSPSKSQFFGDPNPQIHLFDLFQPGFLGRTCHIFRLCSLGEDGWSTIGEPRHLASPNYGEKRLVDNKKWVFSATK